MKRPAQIVAAVFALAPLAATPYFWFTAEPPPVWNAPAHWARKTELRDQLAELHHKGLLDEEEAVEAKQLINDLKQLWSGAGAPDVDIRVERVGGGWQVTSYAGPQL